MDELYKVTDVFTPTTPARLTFVERKSINKRIVRALKTPGTQVIVYGHTGSGKTTLLENKLFQVYDNHIKTSCMKNMDFNSVLLNAFDQLNVFYCSEKTSSKDITIAASVTADYKLIKTALSATSKKTSAEKDNRIIPPQLTAQNLAKFMGEAGCCWVIDDFHKIDEKEKPSLSQLMKVFMDMSSTYPDLKTICVGAVSTARQVVECDSEMKERVAEIKVPLMTSDEIKTIVNRGFELLNLELKDKKLCGDIFHFSSGLASICHKLCLLMCESAGIIETLPSRNLYVGKEPRNIDKKITSVSRMSQLEMNREMSRLKNDEKMGIELGENVGEISHYDYVRPKTNFIDSDNLRYAINEYLEDSSDTIKSGFDKAFKIKGARIVLESLTEVDEDGDCIEEILKIAKTIHPKIKSNEVESILQELQCENNGDLIRYNPDTLLYSFTTPFLKTFARSFFEHVEYRPELSTRDIQELINKAFSNMKDSV